MEASSCSSSSFTTCFFFAIFLFYWLSETGTATTCLSYRPICVSTYIYSIQGHFSYCVWMGIYKLFWLELLLPMYCKPSVRISYAKVPLLNGNILKILVLFCLDSIHHPDFLLFQYPFRSAKTLDLNLLSPWRLTSFKKLLNDLWYCFFEIGLW